MALRFGPYVAAALEKKGINRLQFARKLKMTPQNFYEILEEKRKFPVKHLAKLNVALGDAVDPDLLRELCQLEHCPKEIRDEYCRLKGY